MKKYIYIFCALMLASCSQYSHRMVRVKKLTKTKVVVNTENSQSESSTFILSGNNNEPNKVKITAKRSDKCKIAENRKPPYILTNKVVTPSKLRFKRKKEVLKKMSNFEKHSDTIPKEEVERKYRSAYTLSLVALIFLCASIFLPFGVLMAAILSSIAVTTYNRYDNPGVPERYVMARTVQIISLITAIAGLLLAGLFLYALLLV